MIYEIKYKIFLDDDTEDIITLQADCEFSACVLMREIARRNSKIVRYERMEVSSVVQV